MSKTSRSAHNKRSQKGVSGAPKSPSVNAVFIENSEDGFGELKIQRTLLPTPPELYSADLVFFSDDGPDCWSFIFVQTSPLSGEPVTCLRVRYTDQSLRMVLANSLGRFYESLCASHPPSQRMSSLSDYRESIGKDARLIHSVTEFAFVDRMSFFGGLAEICFWNLSPTTFQLYSEGVVDLNACVSPVVTVQLAAGTLASLLQQIAEHATTLEVQQ